MGLRVVAGSCRGRRLVTPDGNDVRPTSDRVREAVFNSLGSMDVIQGALVLDLFCGSGAMGIEALSRGAAHATFVDASSQSITVTKKNLETCGLEGRATVVRSDALRYLRGGAGGSGDRRFDLAILDPPYVFDDWRSLLELLDVSVALVESDRSIELPVPTNRGELVLSKERRYGGTVVSIASVEGRNNGDGTWES